MRAFFILVLFSLAFSLIAVNRTAGVYLTPDTAAAISGSTLAFSSPTSQPKVMRIQENPATSQVNALVAVLGSCSDPYTVRADETLS